MQKPSIAETTASPVTGHADGRPDNALRVLGRREGLVSTTTSRDMSSVECLGGPEDRAASPDLLASSVPPSDCASRTDSSASSFRAPPAGRLMTLGQRAPADNARRFREMSNEASYVSLERLHSDSRIAAERRCKDNHPMRQQQCTYEYMNGQARYHAAEETNVSRMSPDHTCS